MPEVAAVGRQSCLKDEPNPLGQIWNSLKASTRSATRSAREAHNPMLTSPA